MVTHLPKEHRHGVVKVHVGSLHAEEVRRQSARTRRSVGRSPPRTRADETEEAEGACGCLPREIAVGVDTLAEVVDVARTNRQQHACRGLGRIGRGGVRRLGRGFRRHFLLAAIGVVHAHSQHGHRDVEGHLQPRAHHHALRQCQLNAYPSAALYVRLTPE